MPDENDPKDPFEPSPTRRIAAAGAGSAGSIAAKRDSSEDDAPPLPLVALAETATIRLG
jgi:hypothetical protein